MSLKKIIVSALSTAIVGASVATYVTINYFGLDYKISKIYSNSENKSGTIMVMPKNDFMLVDGFDYGIVDNSFDKLILGNTIIDLLTNKPTKEKMSEGSIYLIDELTDTLNDYLITVKKELMANQSEEYVDKLTKDSKYNKLLKNIAKKTTNYAKKITKTPSININRSEDYEFYQVYVNNSPIIIGKNSVELQDRYYITSKERRTELGRLVFELYNTLENFKDLNGNSYAKPTTINHTMSEKIIKEI